MKAKIKEILEKYIEHQSNERYAIDDYIHYYKNAYKKLTDYIRSDLNEELLRYLKTKDRDEQIEMIEFINQFSNLNLKVDDFKILKYEYKRNIQYQYVWNVIFYWKNNTYRYLSDFFEEFIFANAEKILDNVA